MPNNRFYLRISVIFMVCILSVFTICFKLDAKPMDNPTVEEAIQSKIIIIAEYIDYSKQGKIGYFNGPIANYKVIQVLRGKLLDETISIHYDFQDGSACVLLKGWRFSDNLMPKKDSQWILFLKDKSGDGKSYMTYRGDYGRWPVNEENLFVTKLFLGISKAIKIDSNKSISFKDEIIEAVLKKIIADYRELKIAYNEQMPQKISIRLIGKQTKSDQYLTGEKNIEKHWIYENGKILESEAVSAEFPQYGILAFMIFDDGDKTTVRLDEMWNLYFAGGMLYEVVKDSTGRVNLKELQILWSKYSVNHVPYVEQRIVLKDLLSG